MSTSIPQAFVQAYSTNVHYLGQQEYSRLHGCSDYRPITGDRANFERIAAAEMQPKTRFGATTPQNIAHSRRVALMSPFKWTEAIDQTDKSQIIINATSTYVRSGAAGYGRRIDDTCIAALDAAALNGDGSTTALPAAQIIGAGAGQKLSLDLLRNANALLKKNEIGQMQGGKRVLLISSEMEEQLFQITEIVSRDYNRYTPLEDGRLPRFLGAKIVVSNRLTNITGNVYRAFMFDEMSLGLAMSQERMSRVAEDPAHEFATIVYFETTLGAVRKEDEGVVAMDIDIAA